MTTSPSETIAKALAAATEFFRNSPIIPEQSPHDAFVSGFTAALAEQTQQGVEVKELEWRLEDERDADFPRWNAEWNGMVFSVFKAWWGKENKWGFVGSSGFHHTEDEAKAAAQSDYETRIRSALVDVPAVESEPVATMDDEDRTPTPEGFDEALWRKADEVFHSTALVADDVECVKIVYAALAYTPSAVAPVAWQPRYKQDVIDHHRGIGSDLWEYAMTVYPTKAQAEGFGHGGHEARPLYSQPLPSALVDVPAVESEPELTCPHIDKAIASGELSESVKAELHAIKDINSQLRYGMWVLKAQLAEAHPPRSLSNEGWRPIETAPKDGTQFLAFEMGGYFNCWWHNNGYGEEYWMDEADSEPTPTHWQPLPTPPSTRKGSSEGDGSATSTSGAPKTWGEWERERQNEEGQ